MMMLLTGCGTKLTFVKPDIVCTVEKILEDLSTLEDEDCNKIYAGKVLCVTGKILHKGTDPDGGVVVTMGFLQGRLHSWVVRAYVKDDLDKEKIRKMQMELPITLQGAVSQKGLTIPRNEDRTIELLDAKIVEEK